MKELMKRKVMGGQIGLLDAVYPSPAAMLANLL